MEKLKDITPLPSRAEEYDVLKTLGRGTYGHCYKVKRKDTNEVLVMKAVSLQGLSEKDREDTLNEAKLMKQLKHENLIRHVESWSENHWLFIIMEHAEAGDLGHVVASYAMNKPTVSEEQLLRYIVDIGRGLQYLHHNRVLHRDIKPSNIFMVGNKAVIADLGLGRRLSEMTACAYSKVGTPLYFSPELCEEKPYNDKSDVWAFGCLIYELATGLPPFTAANQVALARKVVTEDAPLLPPSFSRDLQQLLRAMLRKAPEDRLSVDMVLGHPAVSACARRLSEERRAASREQELPPQPKQPHEKWTPAAMQRKFEEQLLEAKQEMEREYEVRLRNVVDTAAQKSAAEHRERESARLVESEKQIRELTERCNRLQLEVQEATNERMVLASAKDYAEKLQGSLRRELEDARRTAGAEQQALVDAEKMQRELIRVNEDTARQLMEVQKESTELRRQLDMERREAGAVLERLEELRGKEVLAEALQRSRAARDEELRALGAELSSCKQQLRAQTSRAVRLEALVAVLRGGDDSSSDIDPNEAAAYHMPSPPASENGIPELSEKEEEEDLDRAGQEAQQLQEEPQEEREEKKEERGECDVPPSMPREPVNVSRSPPEASPTPLQPGLVAAEHRMSPYEVAASPLVQLSAAPAELSPVKIRGPGAEAAGGRLQDLIDLASLSPIRSPMPEDRQEDSPLLLPCSHQAPPDATTDSQADLSVPFPIAPEIEAAQSKEEEAEKEDSLVVSVRVMCNGGGIRNEQPLEDAAMPWMNLGLGDSFGRSGGRRETSTNGSSGRSAPVHLQGIFKGSSEAEGPPWSLPSSDVPLKATENQGPYDEALSAKGPVDAAAEEDSSSQQASFGWSLQQPMLSESTVDDADASVDAPAAAEEVAFNLSLPEPTPDSADGCLADRDAVQQRSRLHELLEAARDVATGNVASRSGGQAVDEPAAVFHEPEDFRTSFDALLSAVSYAHPLPSREPSPPRRRECKEEEAVEAEDGGAALGMAAAEETEAKEKDEETEELLHLGFVPIETFRGVSAPFPESLLTPSPSLVPPFEEEESEDLMLLGVAPAETYRAVSAPPPESQLRPSPVLPGQQKQQPPQMHGGGELERPRTAQAGLFFGHRMWSARASRDEDERPMSAALSAIAMAGDFVDDADLLSSDDDNDRIAAADGFGKRRAKKEAGSSGAALRGAAADEGHIAVAETEAHVEASAAEQVQGGHQGTGAGLARARAVNLAGLGVDVPEGMDKLAEAYFPVLLSWQRASGIRRESQLRGTVVETVWGNKERYKLSAGSDSALEVLFRPAAGAGGHGVRKVMARRGSRPDFVRLEASPAMALHGGWRFLTAVVPFGTSHGGRGGVSSSNAAGDLAEVILEFSRPNPADEVLVLRSESRLRQTLVAASEAFFLSSPGAQCRTSDTMVFPPAIGFRAGSASPGPPAGFRRTPGARSSLTTRDRSRPGAPSSSARPRTAAKRSSTGSALSAEAVASPEPGVYSALRGQVQLRRGKHQQQQRGSEPPASTKEQRVEKEAAVESDREWHHQGEYSEGDGGRWPLNSSQIALLLQRVERQKNQKRRQSLDRAPGKEDEGREGSGQEEAGAEDKEAEETGNSSEGPSFEQYAEVVEGMPSQSVAAYQAAKSQARAEEERQLRLGERAEEEGTPRASSIRTPPPPEPKPTDALMEKILSFNKAVASSRKIIEAVASPEQMSPATMQREGSDEEDETPTERQPLCPMENNGDGAGGSGSGQRSSRRLSQSGRRRRSSSRGRGAASSGPDAAVRQSLESTQLCQAAHSRQEQLFAAVRLLGTSQPRGSASTGGGRTPAGTTPGASSKAGRRSRTPSRSTSRARLTPPN